MNWIKRHIRFHDWQHPREMGGSEIESFLTHLAVTEKVAVSTTHQAKQLTESLYIPFCIKAQQCRVTKQL
ncbi:MAG: phage integrase N-terminal SAM-like domain-containing protein [Leptolyngbyaceae cyanobacterium]